MHKTRTIVCLYLRIDSDYRFNVKVIWKLLCTFVMCLMSFVGEVLKTMYCSICISTVSYQVGDHNIIEIIFKVSGELYSTELGAFFDDHGMHLKLLVGKHSCT